MMTITSAAMMGVLAAASMTGANAPTEAAVQDSAPSHADRATPGPLRFEMDWHRFGASLETWSARWWRWTGSMPPAGTPGYGASGVVSAAR